MRVGGAQEKVARELEARRQVGMSMYLEGLARLTFRMAEEARIKAEEAKPAEAGPKVAAQRAAEYPVEDRRAARRKRTLYYAGIQSRFSRSMSGREIDDGLFLALGYTCDEARSHLERQFMKGMTWSNYAGCLPWRSPKRKWHVDHIVPKRLFAESEVRAAYALSNLRPLWERDNRLKGCARTHLI